MRLNVCLFSMGVVACVWKIWKTAETGGSPSRPPVRPEDIISASMRSPSWTSKRGLRWQLRRTGAVSGFSSDRPWFRTLVLEGVNLASSSQVHWFGIYIYMLQRSNPPLPPKGHGTPLPPCGVVWGGLGLVVVVVVGVVVGLVVVVVVEVVVVVVVVLVLVVLVVHDIL